MVGVDWTSTRRVGPGFWKVVLEFLLKARFIAFQLMIEIGLLE